MSETEPLKVISEYSPMGDQPAAIDGLVEALGIMGLSAGIKQLTSLARYNLEMLFL